MPLQCHRCYQCEDHRHIFAQHQSQQCNHWWAHENNKSERTFHRWFKSETGMSFQAWRNRVCIIYALNALKNNISITEIAFSLGYEHSAAFTAMFSKIMGYPPTHFLKRFHTQNETL
ncbi:AraC family transcriptional regulator [Acinetobacter calcoaceticus]|nr:AraC family transcriptional regulator [Acinetobacter calcoaceticus]